jgi:hypothetical protein
LTLKPLAYVASEVRIFASLVLTRGSSPF